MKIVVLAGGLSPERDVSLSSGSKIANALLQTGHQVAFVDLYEGIKNFPCNLSSLFFSKSDKESFSYKIPEKEVDLEELIKKNNNRKNPIGNGVLEICKEADITFIALHGGMGENGQLQAIFDSQGIKYTGSGYKGCLLSMDKHVSKLIYVQNKIPTAPWLLCRKSEKSFLEWIPTIIKEIGLPCVVKPCGCGSSVGVSLVNKENELEKALIAAEFYEKEILVEKTITGREFSVGILQGKALPPIEIIPKAGFYDYKNKYQANLTEEITPANLSEEETKKVQELSLLAHKTLFLGSYSRTDFILDKDGVFWCLETNTLPGMTPTSLLPQEAQAIGIDYETLCNTIVSAPVKN